MARRTPRPRSAYADFIAVPLRWNDNDQYGHVYQGIYAELFDCAMNDWLLRGGLLNLTGGEPCIVVAENGFSYFREVRYPDRLEVGLRIDRIGGASCTLGLGMFRAGEEAECAQAYFVVVNVSAEGHQPKPWAEDHRALWQTLARD